MPHFVPMMTRFWFWRMTLWASAAAVCCLGTNPAGGGEPSFDEVYAVLKTNLPPATAAQLRSLALEGLLARLHPQAVLVTNNAPRQTNPPVAGARLIEGSFGYVRAGRVESGLAEAMRSTLESLSRTNQVEGWILDLRFAGGNDYQAAADTASLFLTNEQALIDFGAGPIRSRPGARLGPAAVAVLVNRQTTGAAEILAAVLRQTRVALILGTNTAGHAFVTRDIPLSNGQIMRVASAPVRLADGKTIPEDGLEPDVRMATRAADELVYLEDPYRDLNVSRSGWLATMGGTNQASSGTNRGRARINEAELTRRMREGPDYNEEKAEQRLAERPKPTVNDPALARALDLLKALAVVNRLR